MYNNKDGGRYEEEEKIKWDMESSGDNITASEDGGGIYSDKGEGDMSERHICPCCGKEVGREHFSCASGAKGGSSGKGEKKSRGSEGGRKAAMVRWGKAGRDE